MNKDPVWRNNSNGDLLQYDFTPPAEWPPQRVAAAQAQIAERLARADGAADSAAPGWLRLAMRLPDGLRAALVAELRAGNQMTGIGSAGWPNEGSIVATLRARFSAARQAPPEGVAWRELNDPHYCREELSQKVAAVEFLIIA